METQEKPMAEKRHNLDDLSREELIKKCKGYLLLAQKAKQVKDDYATDNTELKQIIEQNELKIKNFNEQISANHLIIESLTESKLLAANNEMELKFKHKQQIKQLNEDMEKHTMENEILQRQIKRQTSENESLLRDLQNYDESLQRIGLLCSEPIQNWEELEEKFRKLVKPNEKNDSGPLREEVDRLNNLIIELRESYVQLNRQAVEKSSLYRLKLSELSGKCKKLKADKKTLSELVFDYFESVRNWQNQFTEASARLVDQQNYLNDYNESLKRENLQLKEEKLGNPGQDELLDEMRELNEALKVRGDVISKQSIQIADLELKLKIERRRYDDLDATYQQKLSEIDAAKEPNDQLSVSTISRQEEVSRMTDIDDGFEEKYLKLKMFAVKLKRKLTEQTAILERYELQAMKGENVIRGVDIKGENKGNKEENRALDELQGQIIKLEADLAQKTKEFIGIEQEMRTLRSDLLNSQSKNKQTNVLSLEIDAYEKSFKELTGKLDQKSERIGKLEETLASKESICKSLAEQIRLIEENLKSEGQHSLELKKQIDQQQMQLKANDHKLLETIQQLDETKLRSSGQQCEIDELKFKLNETTANNIKKLTHIREDNERIMREMVLLRNDNEELTNNLRKCEIELIDIKTEYAGYKVRAQSILKENKSSDRSKEIELEDKLKSLELSMAELQSQNTTLTERNRKLDAINTDMKLTDERLQARCAELLQLLEKCRQQKDQLIDDNRLQLQQNQDAIKSQRLQIDTLIVSYKKQIDDLERKFEQQMDRCREEQSNRTDRQMDIIVSERLPERQECEGSESVTSAKVSVQRNPPPELKPKTSQREQMSLDVLLSTSYEAFDNVPVERSLSPTVELQETKHELVKQENRIKHLTVLLTEAEQDVAKLNQLNDMLKEEVRRHQRSTERESHLNNMEYIKNIIFKFLTINNKTERCHLVPVLNTILKLSPDEFNHLNAVARGDGNGRGWTGYLSGWKG